jgi:hypothetical protein
MKRIIFFIPFRREYIGEMLQKCYDWCKYIEENKENYQTYITWYDNQPWPVIEHTFANTSIYIRGHGHPGGNYITSDISDSDICDVQELCVRLIAAGLDEMSLAEIKLWNCSSGADSGPNISFAKKVADEMRRRGYTLCKFYGYTQSISGYYTEGHKWAVGYRSGVLNWLLGLSGRYIMGRASDYRLEV